MKTSCFFKRLAPLGLALMGSILWADDTTAPSTSTLTAVVGSTTGKVNLSWSSAGDDDTAGDLTGSYRIQYATYSATWDTSSTPTNATTLTLSTTSASPGVSISTTISGLTPGATYYVNPGWGVYRFPRS